MPTKDDFFTLQNLVEFISRKDFQESFNYIDIIKAFSRLENKSIYIVDYQKKGFDFVSDNPLFLCGHTPHEVLKMGYDFYIEHVPEEDLKLLLRINEVGFNFYNTIPLRDRKEYTISYDFRLKNKEGKIILVNQKLTPLFLTEDGKIWKSICTVSLSNYTKPGNIKIFKKGNQKYLEFDEKNNKWTEVEPTVISEREKEILLLSIRGFNIEEIAEKIFVSSNTVKFHRKKMFEKFEVSNIAEAISFARNNYLI